MTEGGVLGVQIVEVMQMVDPQLAHTRGMPVGGGGAAALEVQEPHGIGRDERRCGSEGLGVTLGADYIQRESGVGAVGEIFGVFAN